MSSASFVDNGQLVACSATAYVYVPRTDAETVLRDGFLTTRARLCGEPGAYLRRYERKLDPKYFDRDNRAVTVAKIVKSIDQLYHLHDSSTASNTASNSMFFCWRRLSHAHKCVLFGAADADAMEELEFDILRLASDHADDNSRASSSSDAASPALPVFVFGAHSTFSLPETGLATPSFYFKGSRVANAGQLARWLSPVNDDAIVSQNWPEARDRESSPDSVIRLTTPVSPAAAGRAASDPETSPESQSRLQVDRSQVEVNLATCWLAAPWRGMSFGAVLTGAGGRVPARYFARSRLGAEEEAKEAKEAREAKEAGVASGPARAKGLPLEPEYPASPTALLPAAAVATAAAAAAAQSPPSRHPQQTSTGLKSTATSTTTSATQRRGSVGCAVQCFEFLDVVIDATLCMVSRSMESVCDSCFNEQVTSEQHSYASSVNPRFYPQHTSWPAHKTYRKPSAPVSRDLDIV